MLTKHCLGVSVGRAGLWMAKTARRDRRLTLLEARHQPLEGVGAAPSAEQLHAGIQALALAPSPRLCLQVALPDPATTVAIFDFKRLPSGRSARANLLRLRFEDEYGMSAADISVAYQPLKGATEGTRLLAVAAERVWLEPLQQGLREAGHVASVIDAASCFRFNLLRSAVDPSGSGALLALEEDHWSLMVWRRGPSLCAVHGGWRAGSAGGELDGIVAEAMRWLRSVLSGGEQESFGCLYLTAADEELGSLQAACEARLSVTVKPFPVLWSLGSASRQDCPLVAVAAALPR
jgi:hypothetical protein